MGKPVIYTLTGALLFGYGLFMHKVYKVRSQIDPISVESLKNMVSFSIWVIILKTCNENSLC